MLYKCEKKIVLSIYDDHNYHCRDKEILHTVYVDAQNIEEAIRLCREKYVEFFSLAYLRENCDYRFFCHSILEDLENIKKRDEWGNVVVSYINLCHNCGIVGCNQNRPRGYCECRELYVSNDDLLFWRDDFLNDLRPEPIMMDVVMVHEMSTEY